VVPLIMPIKLTRTFLTALFLEPPAAIAAAY
jgi:hypothetical protein